MWRNWEEESCSDEDKSARQARSTSRRGSFVNKHTGSLNEFELTIGSVDRDFEHGDIFQSNYVGIKVQFLSLALSSHFH